MVSELIDERISDNFYRSEFACRCGCGYAEPNPELVEILEKARNYFFGRPMIITSGCRCERWNKMVCGKPESYHLSGDAADHFIMGVLNRDLQRYYLDKYEGRYGVGCYVGFTHIDVRESAARWKA